MEQEWNGRLAAVEERVCSNTRRIGALEQSQEALRRLATAVEVLAAKQETVAGSVSKLSEKMDALEQKPGKRWDGLIDKLLFAAAGAVIAWVAAGAPGA